MTWAFAEMTSWDWSVVVLLSWADELHHNCSHSALSTGKGREKKKTMERAQRFR